MSRTLSLPHEHGAYLTLAGATIAGAAVGHAHADAVAFALVLAATFFARGPAEAMAVGRARRGDGIALTALTGVAGAAAGYLSRFDELAAVAAAAFAVAIIGCGLVARLVRQHRTYLFEIAGMAAVAASSGAIARVGGASARESLLLALVLAAHTTVAVPLVRAELRKRERERAGDARAIAAIVMAAAAFALLVADAPYLMAALLPRTVLVLLAPRARKPSTVGVHETIALAATVAIALATVRM
jgi:hypothetical protein